MKLEQLDHIDTTILSELATNARASQCACVPANFDSTGYFMSKDVKKVVLAYSGGIDTSIILKRLQTTYGCEVVTFTADLGQGEELEPARQKALLLGIKPENIFIEDLREEFVRD